MSLDSICIVVISISVVSYSFVVVMGGVKKKEDLWRSAIRIKKILYYGEVAEVISFLPES